MNIPTFNPKIETINEYMRKVELYKLSLTKQKYNIVLKFINDLFELEDNKYTALTSVKYIPVGKTDKHLEKIMSKYKKNFKKHLKCEFDHDDLDFCKIMGKLLKPIGYKLRIYTKYEKEYFMILKR